MTDWYGAESTERKRKELTEQHQAARAQLLDDMRFVLSDERGQRCVVNMLRHCRLGVTNFTGNSETFKLEGKREVALAFLGWMREADPKAARKIVAELFVGDDHD